MLTLHLDRQSVFIEETGIFVDIDDRDVTIEHSLYSMAQWESEFEKPFLAKKYQMSVSESIRYLQFMVVGDPITVEEATMLYGRYSDDIRRYLSKSMTATTFSKNTNQKPDRSVITAEIIYYWLFSNQIPIECEHWHLNRLLTLLRVFGIKNSPKKKMSRNAIFAQQNQLNAARQEAKRTER